MGYELSDENLSKAFVRFKALADKKKEVFDDDLIALVEDEVSTVPETFVLDYLQFTSGTGITPTAMVRLRREGKVHQESGWGDGPVEAAYRAIDTITGIPGRLKEYSIRAVTGGKDALGEVMVTIEANGRTVVGRGTSTDVIEASVRAYINAINKVIHKRKGAVEP